MEMSCAGYALDTGDCDSSKKKQQKKKAPQSMMKISISETFINFWQEFFCLVWLTKTYSKTLINEAGRTESRTYTARHVSIALIVPSVTPQLERFLLSYDRGHV